MNNAWNIKGRDIGDYGCLPTDAVYEWATHQAELSEAYQAGKIAASDTARKREILARIQGILTIRSNFGFDAVVDRMNQISSHLDDPGLLENFEYFDIPSSDFMLQFYFAVWDRRIAEVMGYLHDYGKDLSGRVRRVDSDDVWHQMSHYEGMNINEKKKSRDIVDFIKTHQIKHATSFGGGNIPERLYGLPDELSLTVFDDGPVSPLEELFPDEARRQRVNYIHEPLSKAPFHSELLGTQELVWMHGVSMYLNEDIRHEMTGAILCGAALLKPGGFMKYDYLVHNESMRRVISTQNWPYDPKNPMTIFHDATSAIEQGRKTLSTVNAKLGGKAFMDAFDPKVTMTEPWGATSVRFTVQKHT